MRAQLSPETVRRLYVEDQWSLSRIGELVGRPPTWTAAVLERQGVARRPASQKGRRRKPRRPSPPRPQLPEVVVPPTRLSDQDLAYAAARMGARPLPGTRYDGDPTTALHLLIHKAAPFQPAMQAALQITLGLEDGHCWPAAYCAQAAGLPVSDVQQLRKAICDVAAVLTGIDPAKLSVPRRLVRLGT